MKKTYFSRDVRAALNATLARHGATLTPGQTIKGAPRDRLRAALIEFQREYKQIDDRWLAELTGYHTRTLHRLIYDK